MIINFENSTALVKALKSLSGAVPTRIVHPITECVKITADSKNQTLTLETTDLTSWSRVVMEDIAIDESGVVCVSYKLFLNLVSDFKSAFNLEVLKTLNITDDKGNYELAVMNPVEFPDLPEETITHRLTLNAEHLDLINAIAYAVSEDATKQILTQFGYNPATKTIASTDGHRLAKVWLTDEDVETQEYEPITIPNVNLPELEDDNVYDVTVSDAFVGFTSLDQTFSHTTRKIDGTFPAIEQVIPKHENKVLVDLQEFITALKRISGMADKSKNFIVLHIGEPNLSMFCEAQDIGTGYEVVTSTVIKANGTIDLGVQQKYLMQTLQSLKAQKFSEIEISYTSATSPILLKPIGATTKQLHLIMPVKIRN